MAEKIYEIINKKLPNPVGIKEENRWVVVMLNPLPLGWLL